MRVPRPSLFLYGGENFERQLLLKIFGELRAIAQTNENQIEAGDDPAIVVVFATGLDEIGRSTGEVGIGPPLSAVVVLHAGRGPGEIVIRGGNDPLAGPFAFVQGKVAKAGVLAGVGVDAAITLVVRTEAPLAADFLPFDALHADRI